MVLIPQFSHAAVIFTPYSVCLVTIIIEKYRAGVALTGAMMSTHFPQLLKRANLSVLSLAATVTLEEEEANVFDSVHHRSVIN